MACFIDTINQVSLKVFLNLKNICVLIIAKDIDPKLASIYKSSLYLAFFLIISVSFTKNLGI